MTKLVKKKINNELTRNRAILRLPRPQGLTVSIRSSQSLPYRHKRRKRKEIYKYLIQQYIQNGLSINNEILTIEQLATYLNLRTTYF